jgi:uncharacterized protein YndB with AHSA1/START domain
MNQYASVATIDAAPSMVWEVLTHPEKLGWILHFGEWRSFDPKTAAAGTVMYGANADGRGSLTRHVIDWIPQRRFSIGLTPKQLVWDFELGPEGNGTKVRFTCNYRGHGLLERAVEAVTRDDSSSPERMQALTDGVLTRLSTECKKHLQFGE